jgi:hypothetical protein
LRDVLNFVDGPGTSIPWTIDFADIGGARYIASEAADATYDPIRVSAFLILTEPPN